MGVMPPAPAGHGRRPAVRGPCGTLPPTGCIKVMYAMERATFREAHNRLLLEQQAFPTAQPASGVSDSVSVAFRPFCFAKGLFVDFLLCACLWIGFWPRFRALLDWFHAYPFFRMMMPSSSKTSGPMFPDSSAIANVYASRKPVPGARAFSMKTV